MANQSEPRYLSVNSSSNSGANVQQWSLKSGDASQYWYLKQNTSTNKIFIVNKYSGKAIDVPGANLKAEVQLTQYNLYDDANRAQSFSLTPAFNPKSVNRILYLLDTDGASIGPVSAGHSAVMLIDSEGRGAYCSLNHTSVTDIKFLSEGMTHSCLINGYFTSDSITEKYYEKALEFKISASKGADVWGAVVGLKNKGLNYNLAFLNCDDYAGALLEIGGVANMSKAGAPNIVYMELKQRKLHVKEHNFS
jgi:hypothetical protein